MEFKCEYCGKRFEGKNPSLIYRFCSKGCASSGRFEGNFDKSLDWEKDADGMWQCPYNQCVSCKSRACDRCGWHPDVSKKRSEQIQEARA